jgi:hypothetical protein
MAKVRQLEKMWKTYDHVYADKGVVIVIDKEGHKHHFRVADAAHAVRGLNSSLGNKMIPDMQRKKTLAFVEKMIPIIREAAYQGEAPKDLATKLVSNVIAGKTGEGKPIPIDNSYSARLERLQFRFPYVKIEEIERVCGELITLDEKIGILHTINSDRMCEKVEAMEKRRTAAAGIQS